MRHREANRARLAAGLVGLGLVAGVTAGAGLPASRGFTLCSANTMLVDLGLGVAHIRAHDAGHRI
jgi:hypothetical protein